MNTARIPAIALSVVALTGVLACGDDSPGPSVPGTAAVTLATPNADDGAVLVTLTGPGLSSPEAASSAYRLYFRLASANELRVLIVGDVSAGILFTVDVADVSRLGSYAGAVDEVAARNDVIRTTLSGYGLSLVQQ